MTQLSIFTNLKNRTLTFAIIFSLLLGTAAGMFANADSRPDLAVVTDSISIFPDEIYENDQVKINFTMENLGESNAENVGIALYVNSRDNPVDNVYVSSIAPGGEEEVTLYWIARNEGNYTLFIFIDFEELIDEVNEDNNIGNIKVFVEKPVRQPFPPSPESAEWWNPEWHHRVPLSVEMMGQREGYVYENKMVYCTVDFTSLMNEIASYQPSGGFSKRTFYPDSVRVIEYTSDNESWYPERSVGREIIFNKDYDASEKANVTLAWVMEGNILSHEGRYYYIYWDTVGNGKKDGEYARIRSGIKNAEFEDRYSTQWKNNSEPTIPFNGGWDMSYVEDPVNENDYCYKIHRKGLLWQKDWYGKLYQNFQVPDGGNAPSYIFNADIYFNSDLTNAEWEIGIDGDTIKSGGITDGWQTIRKDVTSYLKGKGTSTFYLKVYITETSVDTQPHEVYAYFDSCWIEALPNCNTTFMENKSHGWWGDVLPIGNEYVAGVKEMNTVKVINVTAIANPKEVIATIYSPDGKFVKSSLPLPDAGFEGGDAYTKLYRSNEQTTYASFTTSAVHRGKKAVELRMSDYHGKWKFEDQPVSKDDTVGLRQTIIQSIHISHLPSLWFWYNIEKYSSQSELVYTVMTEGSSNKFHKIKMSDSKLIKDGEWHKFKIDDDVLNEWKAGAGAVVGIEIRLVANEEGGENTIYIDDMGYSFMPSHDGADRTSWYVKDFYTFQNGTKIGDWRLDVSMTDGSGYMVERSISINVKPSANLDVTSISAPSNLKEGEEAVITVKVKNSGLKDVEPSEPFNVSLIIYQEDVPSNPIRMVKGIAGLKKGETKEVKFFWHASYGDPSYDGEWMLMAKADEDGIIPEGNEEDNRNWITMNVEPLPDLEINMDDIGFDPSHPALNDTVNITAVVHNIGYNGTTAEINFYVKEKGGRKYILIQNGSVEKIIGKRSNESVYIIWKPDSNGTYSIKVETSCSDESNSRNNIAIKDIRVGGGTDTSPPYIYNVRVSPSIQYLGEYLNISATIGDNDTTIDKAVVVVSYKNVVYVEEFLLRLGDTDIYYYNNTYNQIEYYHCVIKAFDTAGWQNMGESDSMSFRIVYEGIETVPPSIRAVTADPQRQVIYGNVNVSALINDSSGVSRATLHVIFDGSESTYDMSQREGSKIFYYSKSYDKVGEYEYYIEAVDSSPNSNKNDTSNLFRYFVIPQDYDMDDVPDTVEVEAGTNPKDGSKTVNVTINNEIGYLLWKEGDEKYVYWDREDNELRSTVEKVMDGENVILFDSDGDGSYDHYYEISSGDIKIYEIVREEGLGDLLWIIPAAILFALICMLFVVIRKKI